MHSQVEIRTVTNGDSSALARFLLDLQYFSALRGVTLPQAIERVSRNVAAALANDSHTICVALQEHAIIGYVAVHWLPCLYMSGPEGFVSELFVGESSRGQRVGARLLDTIIAEARERGCSRLELTNIRERESYQRGFYRKQGWEEREYAANFVYRL